MMAGWRSGIRNRRVWNGTACRGRVGRLVSGVGAFLAFGTLPFIFSSSVYADDFGIGDLTSDLLGGAAGNLS